MSSSDERGIGALPTVISRDGYPSMPGSSLERNNSPTSSSQSSVMNDDGVEPLPRRRPQRPKLGTRKSSGTIIISRESAQVEITGEEYDDDDPRMMSPRRTMEEIERLSEDAKEALIQQAKALQASLLDLVDRVETVRSEHEKLEGGNRFLQSYIGELMQTSKITSSSSGKGKGKGRSRTHK